MWYESQLVGVVVGALLGFLLSEIPAFRERRRLRRALVAALRAEMALAVAYCRERLGVYERMRGTVVEGGKAAIYHSDFRLDDVFSANAGNLWVLPDQVIPAIVAFYQRLNEFRARTAAISEALTEHSADRESLADREFLARALEKTVAVLQDIVTRGDTALASQHLPGTVTSSLARYPKANGNAA